jgi:hypothetical protein
VSKEPCISIKPDLECPISQDMLIKPESSTTQTAGLTFGSHLYSQSIYSRYLLLLFLLKKINDNTNSNTAGSNVT